MAVQQRFHGADDVMSYLIKERVYTSYGDSLVLATHGDMKKKQWRKLPSIMMSEARDLPATTEDQIVTNGHLQSLFGERLWIVIPTEKRRSASCERHQPTHKTNAER